jgi:hypothetical protein
MFPPNRVLMLEELLLLVEGPTCQFIAVFDFERAENNRQSKEKFTLTIREIGLTTRENCISLDIITLVI